MPYINADIARLKYNVDGTGITVAVVDSGCFARHQAFTAGQVLPGEDFTGSGGAHNDATGHGTSIAAVIACNPLLNFAPGIAPGAKILPLKVNHNQPQGNLSTVLTALNWLLKDKSDTHEVPINVNVICISLSDGGNYNDFSNVASGDNTVEQKIAKAIRQLRQRDIPTVVAAGNGFKCEQLAHPGGGARSGMPFPAIMPECISVGAVYNDNISNGAFPGYCGADATATSPNQITPFSQRLPRMDGNSHFTRLFAPGSNILSADGTNNANNAAVAIRDGTSIAAPFVAGVIALMQQLHLQDKQTLPHCTDIETYLLRGAETILDNNAFDNVIHTGKEFKQVDALGALDAMFISPMA